MPDELDSTSGDGKGRNQPQALAESDMVAENGYVKMDAFDSDETTKMEEVESASLLPSAPEMRQYVDFHPSENEYLKPMSMRLPIQK